MIYAIRPSQKGGRVSAFSEGEILDGKHGQKDL